MFPVTITFSAEPTEGTPPYTYRRAVTTTFGVGINIISSDEDQMFDICAWD